MPSIRCVFVLDTTCYFCDSRMSKVYCLYDSSWKSGKYIRFELNGTKRTTIVDIFNNITQRVRGTGIHLKGYSYSFSSNRQRAEKQ